MMTYRVLRGKDVRKGLVWALGLGIALCAGAANTWHVDVANEGKSGMDGTTRELAFGDIQSAIDAASTQAGDTILIWPGDYQTGLYTNTINGVYSVRARVYVTKANLTIRAAEKGSVRIIGEHDPDCEASNYGVGPKAIACVCCSVGVNNDKPFATYLEGIQLVNGATTCFEYSYYDSSAGKTKTPDAMGGGFYNSGNSDSSRNFLVDCVISNCVAGSGGGATYVSCHRCVFVDNYSTYGSAIRGGKAANSLFLNNRGVTFAYSSAVNCTIYGTAATTISAANVDQNSFYNDVLLEGSVKSGLYRNGSVTNTAARYVLVAPGLGDYRVLANSPAAGAGDVSYLSGVTEPAGVDFVRKDLAGNALPDSGALQAGCYQEVVTPQGGLATFNVRDDSTMASAIEVDGHCVRPNDHIWATAWPTQWCVRAAATSAKPLHSIKAKEFAERRFPGLDEGIWITAPAPDTTNAYVFSYAQEVRYVNKATGSDDYDGTAAEPAADAATSKVGPWRTIQKSIDDAAEYKWRRVYVAPGTYDEGGDLDPESSGGDLCSRVSIPQYKYVFITSTGGAANTLIVGAADPKAAAEDEGLGTNAVRCVFCYCEEAAMRGFTLTNGHTRLLGRVKAGTTKVRSYGLCGAAWYGDSWGTLLDSVIVGNHGCRNILYSRCRFERCKVAGNTLHETKGSVLSGNITATACVFAENDGVLMETSASTNVNATCVGGAAEAWLTAGGNDAKIFHSIVADYGAVSNGVIRGCLFDNTEVTKKGAEYVAGAAHFIDKEGRDFRVGKESDAVGVTLSTNELKKVLALVSTTFDGQPALLGGRANVAGALRDPVRSNKMYVTAASGGLKVNGAAPADVSVIAGETTAVLTIDKTNATPVTGVTVNGVFHALGDDESITVTAADMDAQGYLTVEVVYATTWYVDAENGDDTNSGFSAAWPKKTLKGVMACARSGDLVLAAEGDYDEETEEQSGYAGALVRVIIKGGVTLRASGAAARTRIVGAAATKDTGSFTDRGLGTNAVRCVRLQTNARIEGFTLTGGRTWRIHGNSYDGGNGSALSGVDASYCVAKDCIITGCDAYGYVLNRVTLVNCRVTGNRSSWNFSRGCNFIGTLLAANKSYSSPVQYCPRFENSTFAADNIQDNGVSWKDSASEAFAAGGDEKSLKSIVNSIVCGKVSKWLCVTNSVMLEGNLPANLYEKVNVLEVSEDELQLDAQYRPKIGFCAATNAANFALVDTATCGTLDLAGEPRTQNGGMDAGCLEADWKGAMAAALGPRATVTAASAGTKLLADGGVQVDDVTLAIEAAANGRYGVTFEMAGGGTLKFYSGETLVEAFTGSGVFSIATETAGLASYRAVYEGEGTAVLRAIRSTKGTVLIVR